MEAEEDYFNADDDEDDHIIPSISAPLNRGAGVLHANALKRKRRVAISGPSRNYRPPIVSASLRATSPPLASLVDYEDDEDDLTGLGGSGGEEDSAAPMRGTPPSQKPQSLRSIELPSSPRLPSQHIPLPPPPPLPSPRRTLSDDEEDSVFESLVRPRLVSSSPSSSPSLSPSQSPSPSPSPSPTPRPPSLSSDGAPPFSMAPLRAGGEKKRRRADADDDDDDEGLFERLSKAKRVVEPSHKSKNNAPVVAGRATGLLLPALLPPKAGGEDDPPKKLKLKFGMTALEAAHYTSSTSSTTTSSSARSNVKAGDTG